MAPVVGRYELVCPLARGGMAEVYLARRRVAGFEKRLVIKRIRRERVGDARFLGLFVQEAKLSMTLVHQNIVPVFDFGRTGEDVFLAMEFVDGTDLATALAAARDKGLPIDPVVAGFIAGECAQALDYAHRKVDSRGETLGVVHRDVTPRNVLLSRAGEVKLVDFGIAVVAGDVDAGVCGTPWYMAPEQARGEPVDGRADLYGLGAVLLEAVSGAKPRRQSDPHDAMRAARDGSPLVGLEAVPAGLRAIVERAVAPDAADRYADARAMATALDGFVLTERARALEEAAPARRLASWLAALGLPRELAAEFDSQAGEALDAVTFMDDGADGVIGTGTRNSMVETVGPGEETGSPGAASGAATVLAPAAVPSIDSTPAVQSLAAAVPHAEADPKRASRPEAATAPRRLSASISLQWLLPKKLTLGAGLGAAAILIGAMALGWVLWRDPHIGPSDAVVASPPDAGAVDAIFPRADAAAAATDDAAPVTDGGMVVPGAAISPPRDAIDAGTVARPNKNPPHQVVIADAGVAAVRRSVTIGARPWAYFYVDSDPAQHQTPETLQLAPGRYRIRFENPELHVSKQAVIDVPADRDIRHVEIMTAP